MKLYYYKDPHGNVGDDLNPWLWQKFFDLSNASNDSAYFVGIGTLLNTSLPRDGEKIVFGAGAGYGCEPEIDESYKIYGVRGPNTARLLGLSDDYVISDPALLIGLFQVKLQKPRHRLAMMPHHANIWMLPWKVLLPILGIKFINPRNSVESVIEDIASSEKVICEAMHGAILSDALGVPWSPVALTGEFNKFKWNDYLESVGLSVDRIPEFKLCLLPGKWGLLMRMLSGVLVCFRLRLALVFRKLRFYSADRKLVELAVHRQLEKMEGFCSDYGLRFKSPKDNG